MKQVKKIIINFPTNIGDALLTLPALDRVKANFPQAEITAITSPRTVDFLIKNNFIDRGVFFDKKWRPLKKADFCFRLRGKFDLIVDFKNSMLPVFLGVKKRTPFIRSFPEDRHSKDRYLDLVKKIAPEKTARKSIFDFSDKNKWNLPKEKKLVFIAPFSSSAKKEYSCKNLLAVIEKLKNEYGFILLGLSSDRKKIEPFLLRKEVIDLTGKTSISDIYYFFSSYKGCVLAVDSSIIHLASYLNLATVCLYGPTSPLRYGPYSNKAIILQRKDLKCVPCQKEECLGNSLCMDIDPEAVAEAIKSLNF